MQRKRPNHLVHMTMIMTMITTMEMKKRKNSPKRNRSKKLWSVIERQAKLPRMP